MIIKREERNIRVVEDMRGGTGEITFLDLMNDATRVKHSRLLSEIIIKPGDSVGEHSHDKESEIYFCLSGKGRVLDEGEYVPFLPGDVHYTTGNDPHAIQNDGDEDLHFLALIVLD